MRKYIKPELDIVKFDGVDVIMGSGDITTGEDSTVTYPSETISQTPTDDQANSTPSQEASPLADPHSSETDNNATPTDIPASDDASGDSAPSVDAPADAADTPVDEQPVEPAAEATPQADAEVVTGDMTTVE